jgi:hypothetical protein
MGVVLNNASASLRRPSVPLVSSVTSLRASSILEGVVDVTPSLLTEP